MINSTKKKKTVIYLISGILVIAGIGTVAYFVWPKKETKTETKRQTKEAKVQQLQSQLSQIENILNKSENSSKKVKYSVKLSDIKNKLKTLPRQKPQEQEKTIQELTQSIKTISQELKLPEEVDDPKPNQDKPSKTPEPPEEDNPLPNKDKNPNNDSPNPDPQPDKNSKGWNYVSTKINDNTYKYKILLDGGEIDFSDFIVLLKDKKESFFKAFQGALKDANSKFPAYFWKCPPVSQKTLDKPFEFVVIKSEELNNITQNWTSFGKHISNNYQKWACSFPSLRGNNTLIIPIPKPGPDLDFKNISQFTNNAPEEQQQALWQEVAKKLTEELEGSNATRWLNTEGTGVPYLHVRLDKKNGFYSNYPEYAKWE